VPLCSWEFRKKPLAETVADSILTAIRAITDVADRLIPAQSRGELQVILQVTPMSVNKVSADERHQMIAEAAYFRAERRGFCGDDSLHDWIEAEAEVSERLRDSQHDAFLGRLEEQLATTGEKLKELRKKGASKKAAARAEWQEDLKKLAELRETFEKKLVEIRERGELASKKVKEQAEDISEQISEVTQKMRKRLRERRR
jgi:DNA anti-recombination protein RmuC